jgi:hypothetical protein
MGENKTLLNRKGIHWVQINDITITNQAATINDEDAMLQNQTLPLCQI